MFKTGIRPFLLKYICLSLIHRETCLIKFFVVVFNIDVKFKIQNKNLMELNL